MAPNEGSDEAMDDKDDAVATSSELGARDFRRNVEAIGHCFQLGGWMVLSAGGGCFLCPCRLLLLLSKIFGRSCCKN